MHAVGAKCLARRLARCIPCGRGSRSWVVRMGREKDYYEYIGKVVLLIRLFELVMETHGV